jgi:hypothetical protein
VSLSHQDELAAVLEELSYERRALVYQQNAIFDGRVTNQREWNAAMDRRRERIHALEQQRDSLISLEEGEAEADWRPAA